MATLLHHHPQRPTAHATRQALPTVNELETPLPHRHWTRPRKASSPGPAGDRRRRPSRSPIGRGTRRRSTSGTSTLCRAGVPTAATCSRCGCRTRARRWRRVSASCGQEAFFEGQVHALSVVGGVESQIGYFHRNHFVPGDASRRRPVQRGGQGRWSDISGVRRWRPADGVIASAAPEMPFDSPGWLTPACGRR